MSGAFCSILVACSLLPFFAGFTVFISVSPLFFVPGSMYRTNKAPTQTELQASPNALGSEKRDQRRFLLDLGRLQLAALLCCFHGLHVGFPFRVRNPPAPVGRELSLNRC